MFSSCRDVAASRGAGIIAAGPQRLRLVVLNYIPRFLTRGSPTNTHTGGRIPRANSELIASAISREPARPPAGRRSWSPTPGYRFAISNAGALILATMMDVVCRGIDRFARNRALRGPGCIPVSL